MDALGQTRGDHETGAAGPLRAERVRLIDDERRTVPLANLDQLVEGGQVAVRAVERIDGDEPGPVRREHAVERLRVVVAEHDGLAPALTTPSCSEMCAFMSR